MDKNGLFSYIDQNAQTFTDLSDEIWNLAELSLLEYKSVDAYVKVLSDLDLLWRPGSQMWKRLFPAPMAAESR